MKMNYALVASLALSTSLIAQTTTNAPAPATAPAPVAPALSPVPAVQPAPAAKPANTPAKKAAPKAATKPAAKSSAKKAAPAAPLLAERPVALVPGVATVNAANVNIRGRSSTLGEVVAKLNKGDTVTVIEQVENKWAKGTDPRQWARIAYPANTPVWVFSSFVDSNKVVTSPRLNLRGGPGENFSIVGRLTKGAKVNELKSQGEWLQIEAPAEATAFIAAIYLKQDSAAIAAVKPADKPVTAPVIEPASTNVITDIPPVATTTVDTNAVAAPVSPELAGFVGDIAGSTNAVTEPEQPLPPRVVMREGVVSANTSIQAPSYYRLTGLDTGRTINYLYTSSTNVNLGRYANLRIIVTGEESLDERWPNTPVLTIQRIQVVE